MKPNIKRRRWVVAVGLVACALGGCASDVDSDADSHAAPSNEGETNAERWITDHGLRSLGARAVADAEGRHRELRIGEVPIWGLGMKVEGGKVHAPEARYEGGEAQTEPQISAQEAGRVALAELGDDAAHARVTATDLVLVPRFELRLREPASGAARVDTRNAADYERVITELTLIYRVQLASGDDVEAPEDRWLAQVDAASGRLIELSSTKVGVVPYRTVTGIGKYVGQRPIVTLFNPEDNDYWLEDVPGNRYATLSGKALVPFTSFDASFGDGKLYNPANATTSPNGETAAVDAFVAVGRTWQLFQDILGRPSPSGLARPLMFKLHFGGQAATYRADPSRPTIELGYVGTNAAGLKLPWATTDLVAHEIGHDYFMTAVFPTPWTAPTGPSELSAMNEATGDIIGMATEMLGDLVDSGRPSYGLDTVPLLQRYTDMADQTGIVQRNLLTPQLPEWFAGIGNQDPHAAAGPITRMFVLLAYGCLPASVQPPTARTCARVPAGFSGIGIKAALHLWNQALLNLTPGTTFLDARREMLAAAKSDDIPFVGAHTKAVADAFAAVNIGTPADRTPPVINSFNCFQLFFQGKQFMQCSGDISDVDTPSLFDRDPELVVDGSLVFTTSSWSFVEQLFDPNVMTEGTHTVTLRAWDQWNNEATQTVSVVIDATPPTATLEVTGPLKQPTLTVTATDASGSVDIAFREGAQVLAQGSSPLSKTFDTATMADGDHTIDITAADMWGNTTKLQQIIHVDNTPPAVSLAVTGPSPFHVSAAVTDLSPITQVDFFIDGVRTSSQTLASFAITYTPSDAAAHTISAVATDSLGNQGSASIPAPKDTDPPAVTFSASQTGTVVTMVTDVSDPCGIVYPWTISVDGILVDSPTVPHYVLGMDTSLAVGVHTFQAVVRDRCGNTNNFTKLFTKVANVPPVITGITRDDTHLKQPKFTVQCVDSDGVDHVEVRKNGLVLQSDSTAPYEFVIDTATWADGDYPLVFQCSDTLGAASDPVTRTVTADNTGPGIAEFTVFGAGGSYVVSAGNVADLHGVQSVELVAGLGPYTFGFDVTLTAAPYSVGWMVPEGTILKTQYPFGATAKDTWGNTRDVFYWCYVDTSDPTPRYLSCDPE